MPARKPSDVVSTTLRLRADLHQRLERAAAIKERPLNGEIAERLAQSFDYERELRNYAFVAGMLETIVEISEETAEQRAARLAETDAPEPMVHVAEILTRAIARQKGVRQQVGRELEREAFLLANRGARNSSNLADNPKGRGSK
jgi:hypothetical protein